MPGRAGELLELGAQVPVEGHPLLLGRGGEVDPVQVEQAGELRAGLAVLVDPQVHRDVVHAAVPRLLRHHQQRGRLPAPSVPAGAVPGPQRGEQPAGQLGLVRGGVPGREHRGQHLGSGQHVALDRHARADAVTRPGEAAGAGVRGGAALLVDDARPDGRPARRRPPAGGPAPPGRWRPRRASRGRAPSRRRSARPGRRWRRGRRRRRVRRTRPPGTSRRPRPPTTRRRPSGPRWRTSWRSP